MANWRTRVAGLTGRRRYAAAFAAGLAAVAALPPIHMVPILIASFATLAWLLDGARSRIAAFWTGWAFGLGFFVAGLYWMSYSFLVDAATYAWMIPFAVPGLSAVAAIYIGLASVLVVTVAPPGIRRAALLPAAWIVFEYLRGILLTGFPWNLIGTVWTYSPTMMQGASLFGAYGLGLVTLAAACAPAAIADAQASRLSRGWFVAGTYAMLAALGVWGAVRLDAAPTDPVANVRLRLVQPDVAQNMKWRPEQRTQILRDLISMSAAPATGAPPTLLIWPETATPVYLEHAPDVLRAIATIVPENGALVTGSPRIRRDGTGGDLRLWNSVHVVDSEGRIRATYDKTHLVPFGEYMPIPNWFGLRAVAADRIDFTAGSGLVTLDIPGAPPASPLICYEAIFPGEVVARGGTPPQWLLNVTNDAWFGISSGPYQHLAAARLRAVEEGLPLARAANNGVSGVYDAYGRTIDETRLGERATLDADLPRPTLKPTIYSVYDNLTLFVVLLIYVVVFPVFSLVGFRATLPKS